MATNNAANNATAATGKVLQGAGVGVASTYSTSTYPSTAGTSGNVLTSDGTNWTSASAALPGQLNVATRTLTSLEIKSLVATPIQLIPAPGVGKVICLVHPFWVSKVYGGNNVFVAGAGQTISVRYNLTVLTGAVITNASIVSSLSSIFTFVPSTITSSLSNYQNVSVDIVNSTVTEISGNAANDNTITITILYYIATL